MKSAILSPSARLAAAATFMCLLASCAIPPREAMRIIQSEGLFAYWSGSYSYGTTPSTRYTSSPPFQTNRGTHTYAAQVPYRPRYFDGSRYMQEDTRIPYQPRPSSTYVSRSRSSRPRTSTITEKRDTYVPTRTLPEAAARIEPPQPRPSSSLPAPSPSGPPQLNVDALPYGTPVAGRPGMVTSPFAQKQQLVDVAGLAPGETVKDPYTGKLFRVPPTQEASSSPSLPPPSDPAPKESSGKPAESSPAPSTGGDTPASPPKDTPATPESPKP